MAIDNGGNIADETYAEYTGQYGDYAMRKDGTVTSLSLRALRSRYLCDPVLPGVRVINMGSHFNEIYTFSESTGRAGAPVTVTVPGP